MSIIVSHNNKNAKRLDKQEFGLEREIQQYIYDNPDIIPVYEINSDTRLFVAAREFQTNSGAIDALAFDQNGNIYVIENGNTDNLKDFLLLPYEDIPQEIKGKYCFDNWIHYIFNLEPYTPIILPK